MKNYNTSLCSNQNVPSAGEDHETEYEYEGSDNEDEDENTMPGEPRWRITYLTVIV